MRSCWSCGSNDDCYVDCSCAKCLHPEKYEEWKYYNPKNYAAWLERQKEGEP